MQQATNISGHIFEIGNLLAVVTLAVGVHNSANTEQLAVS
jgi:hypothetical protein